jgi:SAM-dependent methyltransferase
MKGSKRGRVALVSPSPAVFGDEEQRRLIGLYEKKFRTYGVDPRSLFVPGGKRDVRFSVLRECGIGARDSVLDVGCGFGDFLTYLQRACAYRGHYTGVDLVPEFIDAAKRLHPEGNFRVADLLADGGRGRWDYVVLSGSLNLSIGRRHQEYVEAMLGRMFGLCRMAVAVDMISSYGDARDPTLFRADPGAMFTFAKTLTGRVCLRHDYMPYEFCMYLFRGNTVTKRKTFAGYRCPEVLDPAGE